MRKKLNPMIVVGFFLSFFALIFITGVTGNTVNKTEVANEPQSHNQTPVQVLKQQILVRVITLQMRSK